MPVTKTCEHCQSTYTCAPSKVSVRKYCSAKCSTSANSKYLHLSKEERKKQYYRNNREKNIDTFNTQKLEHFKTFYQSLKGRAAHMLNNARQRAKRHGVKCDLTREWIQEKLRNGKCEVTGIDFVVQINGGRGHRNNPWSPSIDRINQDGDYTPDNCRMTIWIYNRARGAFPDNAFDTMIEALRK